MACPSDPSPFVSACVTRTSGCHGAEVGDDGPLLIPRECSVLIIAVQVEDDTKNGQADDAEYNVGQASIPASQLVSRLTLFLDCSSCSHMPTSCYTTSPVSVLPFLPRQRTCCVVSPPSRFWTRSPLPLLSGYHARLFSIFHFSYLVPYRATSTACFVTLHPAPLGTFASTRHTP
jgi:hypothetical protein